MFTNSDGYTFFEWYAFFEVDAESQDKLAIVDSFTSSDLKYFWQQCYDFNQVLSIEDTLQDRAQEGRTL